VQQVPSQSTQLHDNAGRVITVPESSTIKNGGSPIFQILKQSIVTISPQVATGGSQVKLTGMHPFGRPKGVFVVEPRSPLKLTVMFGALPAAYASINPDGTITAGAPYAGQPGSPCASRWWWTMRTRPIAWTCSPTRSQVRGEALGAIRSLVLIGTQQVEWPESGWTSSQTRALLGVRRRTAMPPFSAPSSPSGQPMLSQAQEKMPVDD
jgi:hypothetical protein